MKHRSSRSLLAIIAAALTLTTVAAAGQRGGVVVGSDLCTVGIDAEEGTSPDAEDLCDVTWEVLWAAEGDATSVAITVRAAGATSDRLGTAMYGVGWESSGCAIQLTHRTGDVLAGEADLDTIHAVCDGATRVCDDGPAGTMSQNCRYEGGEVLSLTVPAPSFEGATVRWVLTFDGALERLAARHAFGGVIDPGSAYAGHELAVAVVTPGSTAPDLYVRTSPFAPAVCGVTDDEGCVDVLGDIVVADDVTVPIG